MKIKELDTNRVQVKRGSDEYTYWLEYWAPPEGGHVRTVSAQSPGILGVQVADPSIKTDGNSYHTLYWDGKDTLLKLLKKKKLA